MTQPPDPRAEAALNELRNRLIAERAAGYVYNLDDVGLPLQVSSPDDPGPVTADGTVVLTGTSASLTGIDATQAKVVFSVAADYSVQAAWTLTTPAGTQLSDVWDSLDLTIFGYLPLTQLRFSGTSQPSEPLGHALLGLSPPASGQVLVEGPFTVTTDGRPSFTWSSDQPLADVELPVAGTLSGGIVTLRSTPGPDGIDCEMLVTGTVPLGPCTFSLPTGTTPDLTLTVSPQAGSTSGDPGGVTSQALASVGLADVIGGQLPASLFDLAGAQLTSYTQTFYPDGDGTDQSTAAIGFGQATWDLPGGLAVSGLQLSVTTWSAPGSDLTYGFQASGNLRIGSGSYTITVSIPVDGEPWYFELTEDANAPSLADLAGLAGLAGSQVTGILPDALLSAGAAIAISTVGVYADFDAAELVGVELTIAQIQPWAIAGGLVTVADWAVDIDLGLAEPSAGAGGDTPGWVVTGFLTGSISVGGATFDIGLELPLTGLASLELAEGSTVAVPAIGDLLALAGGETVAAGLPVGVTSFGGLQVTDFRLDVDLAAGTVQRLTIGFTQTQDWTIIPGLLAVTGVWALIQAFPGEPGAPVSGSFEGTLSLADTDVDVVLVRNPGDAGNWQLSAGYEQPVHVPGFAELNDWLSPTAAQAALPGTLPLSGGLDVGDIALVFDGATGALTSIGFCAYVSDLWTLMPGQLSITQVAGQVSIDWTGTPNQVTGTVSGVLTLAGVEIGIGAAKPQADGPWTLTGRLIDGVDVDLQDLASTFGLFLPDDAVGFGLPAQISITGVAVTAVPDTGQLNVAGSADFDWRVSLGAATVAITSISGTLDIPPSGSPPGSAPAGPGGSTADPAGSTPSAADPAVDAAVMTLTGRFGFGGIAAAVTLAFGTSPLARTVLTGVIAAADASAISVPSPPVSAASPGPDWCRLTCCRCGTAARRCGST